MTDQTKLWPPSDTVARLVEAAEAAVRTVMDDAVARGWKTVDNAAAVALLPGPFRAAIALRDAIAAHRASVDALGAGRGRADPEASIHVVLARAAAEAAEQRAAKAERDMDAAVKQAHADLDAANDHAANLVHEIAQLKATHDTAICRRDQIRDAQRERNAVIDALNETRETLRAGPREQAQDAAKRVVAERDRIYDEREILARDRDRALAERDEARKERDVLFATREGDRRMLKDRDEDYERTAAERDALKTEVERLQAEVRDEREARNRCANAGEEERVQMREDLARLRADPRLGLHFGVCRDGKSLRASFGSWQDAEDSARDWSLKTAKGRYEVVSSGDLNVHVAVSPEAVDEVIAANADKITPPSPAPLDPRALWIADKTWDLQMRFLRVETREDGKSGWSACDASEFVAFATETLRVAEAEARKGVGK